MYKQKQSLFDSNQNPKDFTNEFFNSLPFKNQFQKESLLSYRILSKYFELCQALRDIIMVGEETNWNLRTSVRSIYRSIGTYINRLDRETDNFETIENFMLSSFKTEDLNENCSIDILNIYEISNIIERSSFTKN